MLSHYLCIIVAKMKNRNFHRVDLLGIMASLTCAVHCSVIPLAIAYGMLGSSFLSGHGIFEAFFIVLSIGLASYTLWGSYIEGHRNVIPLIGFFTGITFVAIGLMFHGTAEIVFATMGGLIIAAAHFYNLLLNRVQLKNII